MTAHAHKEAPKGKHKDDSNPDNPHEQDQNKAHDINFQDPAVFNALTTRQTVADAEPNIAYATDQKAAEKKYGSHGSEVVDPVYTGSLEVGMKGINPTEAEIETGARKPVKAPAGDKPASNKAPHKPTTHKGK